MKEVVIAAENGDKMQASSTQTKGGSGENGAGSAGDSAKVHPEELQASLVVDAPTDVAVTHGAADEQVLHVDIDTEKAYDEILRS